MPILKLTPDERQILVRHIIRHKSRHPEKHALLNPLLGGDGVLDTLENAEPLELLEVQLHALKILTHDLLASPEGTVPNKRRQLGHLYYHAIARTLGGATFYLPLTEDQRDTVERALFRKEAIKSRRQTYARIGHAYRETREWGYNGTDTYPGDVIPLDDLRVIEDALRNDPSGDAQRLSRLLDGILKLPELPPGADTNPSWRIETDGTV